MTVGARLVPLDLLSPSGLRSHLPPRKPAFFWMPLADVGGYVNSHKTTHCIFVRKIAGWELSFLRETDSMLIGYARVSKTDGSQLLDLQRDALIGAGVAEERIYGDRVSGAMITVRAWMPA